MAKLITEVVRCDKCTKNAETFTIGYDNVIMEVDLCETHSVPLHSFMEIGRPYTQPRQTRSRKTTTDLYVQQPPEE